MHPRSLVRRRPSAPMVISLVALFLSIGGVGWAATQLPAGSVGTRQLRNGSVTNSKLGRDAVGFRKIIPGAVGARRINQRQVQVRVGGKCLGASAIASISQSGKPTCVPTSPIQIGTVTSGQVAIAPGNGNTVIAAQMLPAHTSVLVFGAVNATATGPVSISGKRVRIACTLNPGGTGHTRTASATVHVGTATESVNIPLVAPTAASSANTTANVACTFQTSGTGPAPTVTASASLNAITTAANS